MKKKKTSLNLHVKMFFLLVLSFQMPFKILDFLFATCNKSMCHNDQNAQKILIKHCQRE